METHGVTELHRAIGRVEGKLDALIGRLAVREEENREVEARVRKVEYRQAWYAGGAAFCALFVKDFVSKWHT